MVRKMASFIKINSFGFLVGILLLTLLQGGCGGNHAYIPPNSETDSKIIIVNAIYDPGFYVEIDNKEAGFLKQQIEVRVTPGKHKLKIFNTETAFSEKTRTITHKFDMKVKVGEGETKQIELVWDDPGYSTNTIRRRAQKDKKESKRKSRENMPGGIGIPAP